MHTIWYPQYPRQRDLGGRDRILTAPYGDIYDGSGIHPADPRGSMYMMVAPEGFVHDGASVPSAVWSIYPPHPLDAAAIAHDLIYRRVGIMLPGEWWIFDTEAQAWAEVGRPMERAEADNLFRHQLSRSRAGVSRWRTRVAYWGIRAWGGIIWRRYRTRM